MNSMKRLSETKWEQYRIINLVIIHEGLSQKCLTLRQIVCIPPLILISIIDNNESPYINFLFSTIGPEYHTSQRLQKIVPRNYYKNDWKKAKVKRTYSYR